MKTEEELNEMVDDIIENLHDSMEFIKSCIYEHYEREYNKGKYQNE